MSNLDSSFGGRFKTIKKLASISSGFIVKMSIKLTALVWPSRGFYFFSVKSVLSSVSSVLKAFNLSIGKNILTRKN